MLAGDHGPGAQFGMRIIEIAANAVQAERLQKVTSAHVVDALMYGAGESGPDFAKMLRDMNARVAIPTTMNTGSADLVSECSVGPRSDYESARDVMRIFRDLGCTTTYTCSPFQEPQNRLRFGEHVAWGESNAVVFANSVFGARTNRYGNVIDIAAALTGRVPYAGLHITENRRATVVVRLEGLPEEIVQGTYFYHVFGYLLGRIAGERITAITGVTHKPTHDELKALGAAAASSGAIPMFHMVGVTPEAATLEDALQGILCREPGPAHRYNDRPQPGDSRYRVGKQPAAIFRCPAGSCGDHVGCLGWLGGVSCVPVQRRKAILGRVELPGRLHLGALD